jgi:hypothetical protein
MRPYAGISLPYLSTAWLESPYAGSELLRFLETTRDMKHPPEPVFASVDPIPLITAKLSGELLTHSILDLSGADIAENGRKLLAALGLQSR